MLVAGALVFGLSVSAANWGPGMDGSNYELTVFDLDLLGGDGSSVHYNSREALNRFVTGESESENYEIRAGYLYFKPPNVPLAGEPTVISDNSIQWNFTDRAEDEEGFLIKDTGFNEMERIYEVNASSITETGLSANTEYCRYIYAFNYFGESYPSEQVCTTTSGDISGCLEVVPYVDYMDLTACPFPNDNVGLSGYYFYSKESGHNSGWQSGDNTWTDPDLLVNHWYDHALIYRDADGNEYPGYVEYRYTLAETPGPTNLYIEEIEDGDKVRVGLTLNTMRNPDYTNFVIQVNDQYMTSGGISDTEEWSTMTSASFESEDTWRNFCVRAKARNEDGIETEYSELTCIELGDRTIWDEFRTLLSTIFDYLDRFRRNELVQFLVKNVVAPALVAMALVNLFVAFGLSGLINFLLYLWQLFTEPFLFFTGKKRKPWGIVYNSLTKQPVDLAMVRLFDSKTKKLVATRITDRRGRFGFIVEEGVFYIEVIKKEFRFPSIKMRERKEEVYSNVYFGGDIKVRNNDSNIRVNIPIDPLVDKVGLLEPARAIRKYLFRRLNLALAILGPILGAICVWIAPTKLNWFFMFLHIVILTLFIALLFRKPKSRWGYVYNSFSRKPIGLSVVRIYNKKYNDLLETQVSDRKGRFGFLVGPDVYTVTAEKPKYKFPSLHPSKFTDYTGGDIRVKDREGRFVRLSIPLDPIGRIRRALGIGKARKLKGDPNMPKTQREGNDYLGEKIKKEERED